MDYTEHSGMKYYWRAHNIVYVQGPVRLCFTEDLGYRKCSNNTSDYNIIIHNQ